MFRRISEGDLDALMARVPRSMPPSLLKAARALDLRLEDPDPKDPDPKDPDPKDPKDPDPKDPDPKDPDPKDPDPRDAELERVKRELGKLNKEKRDRERKEAEEAGDHDKIVKQAEQERDEAKAEADAKAAELTTFKAEADVRKVAGTLKFHDAEDAVLRTPSEVAAKGEAAIEKHLRELATKSPHLVGEGKPRSGATLPDNDGGEVTQLSSTEGMTPEQIVKATKEGRLNDYLASK